MDNTCFLFKAKRYNKNNEWVQGYHNKDQIGNLEFTLMLNKLMSLSYFRLSEIVDVETYCTYAGFEDINGCEIFLNDIVRFEDDYNNEYFGRIKFNSEFNVYIIEPKNPICFIEQCHWSSLRNLEVIGNVFDDTEW